MGELGNVFLLIDDACINGHERSVKLSLFHSFIGLSLVRFQVNLQSEEHNQEDQGSA